MCTVCGCGEGDTRIEGQDHDHEHHHHHGHSHDHAHVHSHVHARSHHHDYSQGPPRAHAPGLSQARMVQIEQDILGKNDQYAGANRRYFRSRGILTLNLVSSPGAGKTTLLACTIERLKDSLPISVIEGDQQTANDAERIRETGVAAVQINTGKGCHLDAHMVGHAVGTLKPKDDSVLFIENVGNLVCPAAFDLGEAHKVVILSVTEGEDKPIKYADMFHAADLMLVSKIDLLPHLRFDLERCIDNACRVNPGLQILQVSAETGEGMEAWCRWIEAVREVALIGRPDLSDPAPMRL
ncbi:MAG: hydrogenase nickel incorporation protein HypB [Pseudomonadota bacterium]